MNSDRISVDEKPLPPLLHLADPLLAPKCCHSYHICAIGQDILIYFGAALNQRATCTSNSWLRSTSTRCVGLRQSTFLCSLACHLRQRDLLSFQAGSSADSVVMYAHVEGSELCAVIVDGPSSQLEQVVPSTSGPDIATEYVISYPPRAMIVGPSRYNMCIDLWPLFEGSKTVAPTFACIVISHTLNCPNRFGKRTTPFLNSPKVSSRVIINHQQATKRQFHSCGKKCQRVTVCEDCPWQKINPTSCLELIGPLRSCSKVD